MFHNNRVVNPPESYHNPKSLRTQNSFKTLSNKWRNLKEKYPHSQSQCKTNIHLSTVNKTSIQNKYYTRSEKHYYKIDQLDIIPITKEYTLISSAPKIFTKTGHLMVTKQASESIKGLRCFSFLSKTVKLS